MIIVKNLMLKSNEKIEKLMKLSHDRSNLKLLIISVLAF
ncbi:cell surface antigen-like Sca8 domain protein [Rickettsia amblyommatis str. Ac/Pa]|uniref:Cell surface antigen-like Sca8 domain protein n=1 Tax=Rickettsia amblyommatis str. Ac/Pa TaxID=1359164 RepID=A0A0F3N174_RICAM|nr:cell surface antigen-like Sca8 domain protein [Rickettsia amblyommatis str. Ac/Pa]